MFFKFVFMDLEFSSVRSTYKRTTVHPPFRLSSFCLQGNKLEWSFVLADVSFVTRFPSNRRFFRQNGWKWSLLRTFMYAVAIVNVMANSSDVNLAKTRYVHFAWLKSSSPFDRINKLNRNYSYWKFFHMFAPNEPRGITFIPSVL